MNNDYSKHWNRCLQLVRENIGNDVKAIPNDDAAWVFDTWFAPIAYEGYDAQKQTLTLRVPDRHVCDYIEHYRMPLWSWALCSVFGPNVRLAYHILQPAPDHPEGFLSGVSPERPRFAIPDARQKMEEQLRQHPKVGGRVQWPSYYDGVADWLTDNKGRGLLICGTTGTGKSTLCCDVLPPIIGGPDWQKQIVVTKAKDMRRRIDELLHARCVVIDELGKDPRHHYSDTDNTFFDLCEASVQGGPLLIIATNLSTTPCDRSLYPQSILECYGPEVIDRLKACTTVAVFTGASMRNE